MGQNGKNSRSREFNTMLSPITPCIPILLLTALSSDRSRNFRAPFTGRLPFLASPRRCRLANASGRIEFIIFLTMCRSLPAAPHPASRRRSCLPLRTDQCFCPTGTLTLLLVRTLRRTSCLRFALSDCMSGRFGCSAESGSCPAWPTRQTKPCSFAATRKAMIITLIIEITDLQSHC
jgi:hypothetical protein